MENEFFEEIKIKLIKIIKISPNQHAGLHRFLFTVVPFENSKKSCASSAMAVLKCTY